MLSRPPDHVVLERRARSFQTGRCRFWETLARAADMITYPCVSMPRSSTFTKKIRERSSNLKLSYWWEKYLWRERCKGRMPRRWRRTYASSAATDNYISPTFVFISTGSGFRIHIRYFYGSRSGSSILKWIIIRIQHAKWIRIRIRIQIQGNFFWHNRRKKCYTNFSHYFHQ